MIRRGFCLLLAAPSLEYTESQLPFAFLKIRPWLLVLSSSQPCTTLASKVAIASSYIMSPEIFLFDNPTSQLDPLGSELVFEAIHKLSKEENTTVIVNEDKVEQLAAFADRLWLIRDGQILIDDEPRAFFAHRELLEESLIRVPPVTDVGYQLRELGIDISEMPLTVDEALSIFAK